MNENELIQLVQWLKPRVEGSRLQDIGVDGDGLWLEIYRQGVHQIYVDLKPGRGFLVLWSGEVLPRRKRAQKPLALFMHSHAKNLVLREIKMKEGFGRVVDLLFKSQDEEKQTTLTLVLIPQAPNAIAESADKKIAWEKPRPLEKQLQAADFPVRYEDWEQYRRDYAAFRGDLVAGATAMPAGPKATKKPDANGVPDEVRLQKWRKELDKKRGAIVKINDALIAMDAQGWRQFGEELKFGRSLEAHPMWDPRLSLHDNRERAFRKSKEVKVKQQGNRDRLVELEKEMTELERWISDPTKAPADVTPARGSRILQKTESKGRTLNLPSGLQAILGRSAKDNLAILRQARAWDLWVHLKDEPSAHAIIFREKNQNVGLPDLEEVALWIFRANQGQKPQLEGVKFDVVVVECRFVRPIKGDKLGRVNYHSPTVYSFASKGRA